jgi:hypothetical protein
MALANNARLAWLRGELTQAKAYANEALQLLGASGSPGMHGLSGAPEPWQIYFDLYRVLHAAGDDHAGEILGQANALVQEQAAKINDAGLRRSFLEHVAFHRAMRDSGAD